MSGTTNTGLVNYINNPVPVFPKNSITIDIFGNTFYRDYPFAASDDVGVFWNADNRFNKHQMLFLVGAIKKSLSGLYDYGHKLRASQTSPHKVYLPTRPSGELDLDFMELFIRAQEKLTIKNIVKWREDYILAAKQVATA